MSTSEAPWRPTYLFATTIVDSARETNVDTGQGTGLVDHDEKRGIVVLNEGLWGN